ncbi:HAMP domain-containing methyl-accepting chemotaxis protein [uncultured Cohaesibacter sp.]|uniref:methyl-accepting chemotaxis protein n=1 Tax=uncultured Cohaesibacter sp. TaxID=1002546 RepID=UPI0029C7460E|nr:HAMP domain-containing methyl-accepting chemotaxis protein [uncultured Cohaesibacter sp.]
MKISSKLAFIVALLMIPTIMLAYMFVNQSNKEIAFASKEFDGDQYLKSIWPVLEGLTHTIADNKPLATPALKEATLAYGTRMSSEQQASDLATELERGFDPTSLLASTIDLITRVGNESNLILDPDLDSYYAMDVIVVKLPSLLKLSTELYLSNKALESDYSEQNRRQLAAKLGALQDIVDGTFASLATIYEHQGTTDRRAALSAAASGLKNAAAQYLALANKSLDYSDGVPKESVPLVSKARADFTAASDALWQKTVVELDDMLQIRIDGFESRLWRLASIAAFFALSALALAIYLGRSISRAIHRSVGEMKELASGRLDITVTGEDRKDEIGEVARALVVFKSNAVQKAEYEQNQKQHEARERDIKAREAAEIAERFRKVIGGISETLIQRAQAMEDAAVVVTGSSEETCVQATAVTRASEETNISVRSVANASESLSQSIGAISHQIDLSAQKAREAVSAADSTITRIKALTEAAKRIGAIVVLIQEIADQTNLLALNATIEAARAGESGKGFAVVASEVKNLATQTAKATTEISTQIADIQSATEQSAEAIDAIAQTNRALDEIVTQISAGIAEQADATRVIADGVNSAADGVFSVTNNIEGVSKAAEQSTQVASDVRRSASDLLAEARHLTVEVDGFVKSLTA